MAAVSAAALRTVTLPTQPAAVWDDFQWSGKSPADRLRYTLDAAKWLLDAGETIQKVAVSCSAGLALLDLEFNQGDTAVVLHITGGMPNTVATVVFQLALTGDDVLNVQVGLPIFADAPAGLVQAWPPADATFTADADGRTADSGAITADAGPAGLSSGGTNTADAVTSTADAPIPTADAA